MSVLGAKALRRSAVVMVVLAVACTRAGSPGQSASPKTSPVVDRGSTVPEREVNTTTVAQAVVPRVAIHDARRGPVPILVLQHPRPSGAPLVFVVTDQQGGWLKVLLPVAPNGSSGWIEAAQVRLSQHAYRISVELGSHRLTVWDDATVIEEGPVGVGKPETPTPLGLFFTTELLEPPQAGTAYGAYAYGLSGSSEVLTSFEGAEPILGLHGTNDPSGLGRDVSAGCVRMGNETITRLARLLPLGVPVYVRP